MPKIRIAHLTDAHLGQRLVRGGGLDGDKMHYDHEPEEHWNNLRMILDDIVRNGISEIVFGGDIGAEDCVGGFFALLSDYDFKKSVILGNHDRYANVVEFHRQPVNAVTGKMCFSRDDGLRKYIFLDTSDNMVGDHQLAWLTGELAGVERSTLFLHHPVLEIDTPLERAGAALRDSAELKKILIRSQCEISVFCGHYHMDDVASEANVRQFVTPAVSYQIAKQAEYIEVDPDVFGYRILEIDAGEIRTEVVMLAR